MKQSHHQRCAITLIELLVVIMILGVLFGLGILFFPDIEQQSRTANGAIALQGWLEIAKQRSQRDQIAHGVRLLPGATNANHVVECQYIEQPDAFAPRASTITVAANTNQASVNNGDLFGGNAAADTFLHPVQAGDYLELLDSGLVHRITGITEVTPGSQYTLNLASTVSFSVTSSTRYRILRKPRVVGEEKLKLPADVIIDLNTNATFGNSIAIGADGTDILFAPSGEIIGTQTLSDELYLWVREQSLVLTDGDPTIIAVRTRSGQIASYPVDLQDTNPADNVPDDPYYQVRFSP